MHNLSKQSLFRKMIIGVLAVVLMIFWSSSLVYSQEDSLELPHHEQDSQELILEWQHSYLGLVNVLHVLEVDNGYVIAGRTLQGAVIFIHTNTEGQSLKEIAFYLVGNNGKRVHVDRVTSTRDGGLVIIGEVPDDYYHNSIPYLAKVDVMGKLIWSTELRLDFGYAELYEFKEDTDGGFLYTVVNEADQLYIAVGKLDASGKLLWEKPLTAGSYVELWYLPYLTVQPKAEGLYTIAASKRDHLLEVWTVDAQGEITGSQQFAFSAPSVILNRQEGGYVVASSDYYRDLIITEIDSLNNTIRTKNYGVQGRVLHFDYMQESGYLLVTSNGVLRLDNELEIIGVKHRLASGNFLKSAIPTQDGGLIMVAEYDKAVTKLLPPISSPTFHPKDQLEDLYFDSESYSLSIGQTIDTVLTAVYGSGSLHNVSGKALYSSSDPTIVFIDPEGNLTGHRQGQAVITAHYGGIEVTAAVRVYGAREDSFIRFETGEYSLSVGETIDVIVELVNSSNVQTVSRNCVYSVHDPSVLTVDEDGNITGHRKGVTVLTAQYNGVSASVTVSVY